MNSIKPTPPENTASRHLVCSSWLGSVSVDEARETLCLVAQLILGWKATTPPAEWSDFDESCLKRLGKLQQAIECDHDWKLTDDSSDVEPAAPYYRCRRCDAEKETD